MSPSASTFKEEIHEKINSNFKKINSWFEEKTQDQVVPFYSSFDIRDSGYKITCVDANVFPAGFAQICDVDQERTSHYMGKYLKKHYPSSKRILLLAEEHTKNLYYWDNIYTIQSLIKNQGYEVKICVPGQSIKKSTKILTATGREVRIHLLKKEQGDLIISNNDFSVDYQLPQELFYNPCIEMGWHSRRKHHFFIEYNKIANEFASLIDMDPWYFRVETKLFSPFNLESRENLEDLTNKASDFLADLKKKQAPYTKEEPYLFLKNNSGTYGLGITVIEQAKEIMNLNYKQRKKMKASKGGQGINELIMQEGVPTVLEEKEGQSAEPVIYMIGSDLTGGFLRGHSKQGYKKNLNSPGAIYRRLCISDLEIKISNRVMENVYGWIGKLGNLALISEIQNRHLDFRGYKV